LVSIKDNSKNESKSQLKWYIMFLQIGWYQSKVVQRMKANKKLTLS